MWIGLMQLPDSPEPAGGWVWVTGEPVTFDGWTYNNPNDYGGEEFGEWTPSWGGGWNDYIDSVVRPSIFEWSADCNNDNIVDYGQILTGALADANSNGIPDICEGPTCHDADLYANNRIDGADLGILLSEWGPVSPSTHSDINHDGRVDGADLGFLLANWGSCP